MSINSCNKTTALLSALFLFQLSFGQSISPKAITSAGASNASSNTKVSYTVGEISVKGLSNGNINLGQGFTSSAVQSTTVTAIQEPIKELLQVKLYPNPASDLLFLDIENCKDSNIQISIYDISGKLISKETYVAQNNHIGINTQHWQTGSYLLQLSNSAGLTLGSYNILKK